MAVVSVRHVCVRMKDSGMMMRVRVGLARGHVGLVRMAVMIVVDVSVLVCDRFVNVPMRMLFR